MPLAIIAAALAPPSAFAQTASSGGFAEFLANWDATAAAARAQQPGWSSPIATTTPLLEQRFRFEIEDQHSGNGASTTILDGGRGLDLIVSENNEIQIALAPYEFRSGTAKSPGHTGFGDWAFLRLKQRLASSPEDQDNYVVSAWLQVQAPVGIAPFTNGEWTFLPTLGFGKGFGSFDIQATLGGVIPTGNVAALGRQIQSNTALQYHVAKIFWPELEVNWTYYAGGPRDGLNQVFLTPGLTIGRFHLTDATTFTTGFGYQIAIAPPYRAKPLTPAYGNAFLFSARVNF
ncbi:MAG TPA: hypothetical protein VKB67_10585 [Rhizomicrobium sp.]|nr:hypothetical protein [Rhizomicrobium sp.]